MLGLFVLLLKFGAVLSIICGFLMAVSCWRILQCTVIMQSFLRLLKLRKLAVCKQRGSLTRCHHVLDHGLNLNRNIPLFATSYINHVLVVASVIAWLHPFLLIQHSTNRDGKQMTHKKLKVTLCRNVLPAVAGLCHLQIRHWLEKWSRFNKSEDI